MMDYQIIIKAVMALAGTGVVLGIILAIASRKLAVEINPHVEAILEVLPGTNCGACGYAGCESAAEVMADGNHGVAICVAGGQSVANQVAHVLGMDQVDTGVPKVALQKCGGGCKVSTIRYDYHGVPTCGAAYMLHGGPLVCEYGCIGFGDCVAACPFDAMAMGPERRPRIDLDKCTGCGICVTTCPMGSDDLLKLEDEGSPILVACCSHEGPKPTRQACPRGCIACKACEKVCEDDAIHVVENLAVVDYDRCTACGKCIEKCPTKCIHWTRWGQAGGFPKAGEAQEAVHAAHPDAK